MSLSSEKRNYIFKLIGVAIVIITVVVLLSVVILDYVKPKEPFYIIFHQYPDRTPITAEFSEDMNMPRADVVEGYVFDGWYYTFNGENRKFDPSTFDPKEHNSDGHSKNYVNVHGKWVYKEE